MKKFSWLFLSFFLLSLSPLKAMAQSDVSETVQRSFNELERFLKEDDWKPIRSDKFLGFNYAMQGKNAKFSGVAFINPDKHFLVFYAVLPVRIPEEKRAEIAFFLTRANYNMMIGNFELDLSDGEVRYKSALDFEGFLLNPSLIKNAIYPTATMMDKYYPGIMSILYGGKSAEEAIAEVEG